MYLAVGNCWCWLGFRKNIWPVKKVDCTVDDAWLSVWSVVQDSQADIIANLLSFALLKSRKVCHSGASLPRLYSQRGS